PVERLLHPAARRPVIVVIDLGPFQEFLLLDRPQELRLADERVAVSVDLARPGRPGRVGHGILEMGSQLEQAAQNGILPHSTRTRYHDQEPLRGLTYLIAADHRIVRSVSEFHANSKSAGGSACQVLDLPVRGSRSVSASAGPAGPAIHAD